jgi:FMN phosphatase YigB (HAD superfamily)
MKTIIFDFNRTLYDPDNADLVDGAEAVLADLYAGDTALCLVSRNEAARASILDRLGIRRFFSEIVFVDQKTADVFQDLAQRIGSDPRATYVVGDYLHEEIRCGNQLGFKTIWLKRGKFADLKAETKHDAPWKTIHSLHELLPLIRG